MMLILKLMIQYCFLRLNKEVRKIKLSEIEVQLRKYKNLIRELLKDYE